MKRSLVEKLNTDFISMTNILFEDILINFGFGTKDEKRQVLEAHSDKKVFMDLTCFDPSDFYKEYPQLKGSFAALFCDENKKVEVHSVERSEPFLNKLRELGFKPVEISIISCGFIFPRTIVQIINEAHYALEEEVATAADIDRAMKYGVNYPKGPFEWSQGKESYVVALLQELHQKTHDQRYLPSKLLLK
jgi:Fe2+ transport system protein FeoA